MHSEQEPRIEFTGARARRVGCGRARILQTHSVCRLLNCRCAVWARLCDKLALGGEGHAGFTSWDRIFFSAARLHPFPALPTRPSQWESSPPSLESNAKKTNATKAGNRGISLLNVFCDYLGPRRRGSPSSVSQQGLFVVGIHMFGQMSSQQRADRER